MVRSSALRRRGAELASHSGISIVPLKPTPDWTGHSARFPATPALPAGRSCGSRRGHQGYRMRVHTRPAIPAQAESRANSIAERCHEDGAPCQTKQHGPIGRYRPPAERRSYRRRFSMTGEDGREWRTTGPRRASHPVPLRMPGYRRRKPAGSPESAVPSQSLSAKTPTRREHSDARWPRCR